VCVCDWLGETKVGRSLLSCDSRPRMKSRHWLSCVRRGGSWHTSLGYRPPIGCDFDRSVWDKNWRDGEAICLPELYLDSEGREWRLGKVGCSEIGVVSHRSCEVELLDDHSGVKFTF